MSEQAALWERLDTLLAELPDDAWTISHDEAAAYRVCTIVIDWRRVPGTPPGLRLIRTKEQGDTL